MHFRPSWPRVGFVDISKAAIAAVKSAMLLVVTEPFDDGIEVPDAACRDVDLEDFDFTFGRKSDINGPAEVGGFLVVCLDEAGD